MTTKERDALFFNALCAIFDAQIKELKNNVKVAKKAYKTHNSEANRRAFDVAKDVLSYIKQVYENVRGIYFDSA